MLLTHPLGVILLNRAVIWDVEEDRVNKPYIQNTLICHGYLLKLRTGIPGVQTLSLLYVKMFLGQIKPA